MGHNQPIQSNPQEQFVQIPLNIEHRLTTPISLTSESNQRRNKWVTIIICTILAVTGQCIARLLENYYFLHRNLSRHRGILTQPLLQVVGFPILIFPFLLHFLIKKQKQLLIFSGGTSFKQLAITYSCLCIYMFCQAFFFNVRNQIPFRVFTLIYTTQLLFTLILSTCYNKIKFNRWMIISLILAVLAGAFTLYTFSAGSPIYDSWTKSNKWGTIYVALCAAAFFSFLLCVIRQVFEEVISICNTSTNRKQPSFVVVLELIIFLSLVTTIILVAAILISGEHHNMKKEMDRFTKGEIAYVRTMVGQAVAWQIYWVGIVGLVFAVSAVFSNVISVCTWPIVSLLVVCFYDKYDHFDVFRGIALGAAALSVACYIYIIHKEKSDGDDQSTS
ncbi:ATPUP15 [Arabidopsis lyrata subsp. lyrata]|uniref:Probable purine permease n=2 Tax=Arabidopsis lyrata subsp. lyrata TaxID=81972 RepID=D7KSP7_ARALL|nr:ATPUP15 [Arabidopsis lyrata subsp. lyrata]